MKKILLFAALAISMHTSAQNLPSTSGIHHQISNFKENPHASKEDILVNTNGPTHNQTPGQLTTIQLNDSIYTWKWDGSFPGWRFDSKIVNIIYDTNNHILSEVYQKWDGSAWVIENKSIWSYDAYNNLINKVSQNWVGGEWVNDYQLINSYDAHNNLTKRSREDWDGITWVSSPVQYTYTYDAKNNKTSEVLAGAGPFSYSYIWTYDVNNNITSELYGSYRGSHSIFWTYASNHKKKSEVHQSDGQNDYKWIYQYDAHNNKSLEVQYAWNSKAWVKNSRYGYTYTYDAKNNMTSEIDQFAWGDLALENVNQFIYTYDTLNNLKSEIKKKWEGIWMNIYKYTFNYDNNNNQVSKFTDGWLGNAWVNYLQDNYTFDADNNPTSQVSQELNGNIWKIVDQSLNTYEADNFQTSESYKHFDLNAPQTVVLNGDSTHYYSQTITAINDVKPDLGHFNLYPNPNSGRFTVTGKNAISAIEIYNLLGERVYTDSNFSQQASIDIDLSDQVKGVYIINIYDGKHMYSRKILVQ